jgi:hypothetical protein
LAFPLIAATALILGYLGLRQYLHGQKVYASDTWDLLYYDLQLLVLGPTPLQNGGDIPLSLQIARFMAPAVTVYAVIEAARVLFASELVRLRARGSRGHDVVCGNSLVSQALTDRLFEERRRVVRVLSGGEQAPRRRRLLFLPGDPTNADVLRIAGLQRAKTLYVCSADAAQNLAVVLAAAEIRRRRRRAPLQVHVQVDDPELCLALQARRLGLPASDRLHVNFFNWHELGARTLLAERPPPAFADRPTRVMVVGATWFGTALTVELARYWRLHHGQPARLLEVVVVDDDAAAAVVRLRRLYPFITAACLFTSYNRRVEALLDGDLPERSPDRVYLCCENEEVALKLALTMDHFWRRGPRSVMVRLSRLGGLEKAFHPPSANQLLDAVSDTLHFFDALQAGSDPRLVEDSLVERLARAIHEHYLTKRLAEGVALNATPAMREWSRLPDEMKAANRAQAADVGPKLQAIGCALAPNPIWGLSESLDDATVERLAVQEHVRWCADLTGRGWTYGSRRDDLARRHPDLVDWDQLPEPSREKDREAIRSLPHSLADAGFQIVRVREDNLTVLPA